MASTKTPPVYLIAAMCDSNRGCWESIPAKWRPLKGRLNVVLSRSLADDALAAQPDTLLCRDYPSALAKLSEPGLRVETIWNVGGVDVYEAGLETAARIYLTHITSPDFPNCDRFFPAFDTGVFRPVSVPGVPAEEQEEKGVRYHFRVYERT